MKIKSKKTLIASVIFVILIAAACSFVAYKNHKKEPVSPYLNSKIDVKAFQEVGGTWGYDILIDGRLYVHQPNIPSIPGDAGFKTEGDAQKIGDLVVTKIKNDVLPPSVAPEELKALGIQ